jgi:WXG100 family type VII secretion target
MDRFMVDLDELLRVVSELASCEERLLERVTDLDARLRDLQDTWSGQAALAQEAAMAEWRAGYDAMHLALDRMRVAAVRAHDNYRRAAAANVAMWQQLR